MSINPLPPTPADATPAGPIARFVLAGRDLLRGTMNDPFNPFRGQMGAAVPGTLARMVRGSQTAPPTQTNPGPSPADRMPAPAPPWWAGAVPVIIFPPKKERGRRKRAKRVAKARTQADLLLKRAQELARKNPRLAKLLGRYGKFGRAGAWGVGPMMAWDFGQWVGGQIYERATDWYYGKPPPPPPKLKVKSVQRRQIKIRVGKIDARMPTIDQAPMTSAPNPTFQPPRNVGAGRAMPAQRPAPQPKLTVKSAPKSAVVKMPKIDPASFPAPAKIPVGRVAGIYARWNALPEWARKAAVAGVSTYALGSFARSSSSPYTRSPTAPAPYTPPTTVGLTSLQASPLPLARTQPDKCKCPKPKKKSGKPACRNPIVSRSRRTRDGRRFSTVTRELKCPA